MYYTGGLRPSGMGAAEIQSMCKEEFWNDILGICNQNRFSYAHIQFYVGRGDNSVVP